jgi:Domain of unknown function (DUF5642)
VVSTGVRLFALLATLSLSVTACGQPPGPSPSDVQITPSSHLPVNPARVDRVRGDLPSGYEIVDLTGAAAPAGLWGLGAGWTAVPTRCGALGDPVDAAVTTRGWSGSGPGGIVHVVVTGSPPLQTGLDPALVADCGHWMLAAGHTSGSVALVDAPAVDGAATVAMRTATTTVVEGGTETHAHADTVTAYLGDYVAFVTVVTDPGSPNPPLGQDFAAKLLVKTLSALRG